MLILAHNQSYLNERTKHTDSYTTKYWPLQTVYLHLNGALSRIKGPRGILSTQRRRTETGINWLAHYTTHLSSFDGGAALLSSGDNSAPVGVWGALSADERLLSISGYCGRPLICITWTLIYVLYVTVPSLYGECLNHWIPYCFTKCTCSQSSLQFTHGHTQTTRSVILIAADTGMLWSHCDDEYPGNRAARGYIRNMLGHRSIRTAVMQRSQSCATNGAS